MFYPLGNPGVNIHSLNEFQLQKSHKIQNVDKKHAKLELIIISNFCVTNYVHDLMSAIGEFIF